LEETLMSGNVESRVRRMGRASPGATIVIVLALAAAVAVAIVLKSNRPSASGDAAGTAEAKTEAPPSAPAAALEKGPPAQTAAAGLPKLVDLGAGKCIPCKMMAPILEALKKDFAGKLEVTFIDVWEKPEEAKKYGIQLIPTQIFYDASGKEQFRHEGFFSREDILGKFKELGVNLAEAAPGVVRETPLAKDERAPDQKCYMCDGDVQPKTRVTIDSPEGKVHLCSPHCFFIVQTSLKDQGSVAGKVAVTDWSSGASLPADKASYLTTSDKGGRPVVRAFPDGDAATAERQKSGGEVLDWSGLQAKETAVKCAFCGRATYPVDSCPVKVYGIDLHACCPGCGLGVAAKTQRDIELAVKDGLTGDPIKIATLNGSVSALTPPTAVAWFGQKKGPDGKMASAGCFKQFFFVNEENLKKWLETHPLATGKEITIHQALADKMKLTPEQIKNACKIGECVPPK
jgi:thioredoxin 1